MQTNDSNRATQQVLLAWQNHSRFDSWHTMIHHNLNPLQIHSGQVTVYKDIMSRRPKYNQNKLQPLELAKDQMHAKFAKKTCRSMFVTLQLSSSKISRLTARNAVQAFTWHSVATSFGLFIPFHTLSTNPSSKDGSPLPSPARWNTTTFPGLNKNHPKNIQNCT